MEKYSRKVRLLIWIAGAVISWLCVIGLIMVIL